MRTTLVNGVRTLNEVETFPRHHGQRRAELVYLRAGPVVKKNVGEGNASGHRRGDRIQELAQGAQPGARVIVGEDALIPLAE